MLRYGGEEVTHRLRCRRALELLAFLAVGRDRPHGRPELARMFWPNADPAAARANLRQVVLELRRLFEATVGGDVLHASRTELALLPRPGLCLDLPPFEDGCPADEDAVAWFDALWRGPLLDMPLASADKGPFARWLGAQRQEQRAHAGRVLEARAECLEAHGRLTAAVDAARRLLQLNPLDETNHHWIMRLLAEDGSPGRALRHYERYRRRLATEAGDEPGSEIQRLARSLAEAPAPAVPAALSEATERRQWRLLTCLCCELIAVTPVADDVDEESLAEGLEQAGRQVVEAIRRRRGLVDARSPDGVIAYFGFPLAGERAVLEAAEAAREIVSTLDGPVRARVGLHSGTFLADFGRGVPDVLGQGPEVARRVPWPCRCWRGHPR
ncbi:MAG: BTAD domain-containing putative transcriptional regulator [Arhodomonas sp.]|nr:BTAD domain-containing putative transcriptional regulator [Arhodomonas sp.]